MGDKGDNAARLRWAVVFFGPGSYISILLIKLWYKGDNAARLRWADVFLGPYLYQINIFQFIRVSLRRFLF
jgi:hypothetical protein